jgi:hypothetical protein
MLQARLTGIVSIVALVVAAGTGRSTAQSPTAGYVALGDSIEFGAGDDVPLDGIG